MAKKFSKTLSNLVRLAICVAALWFVLRGVKIDDRVTLKNGGGQLSGAIVDLGDSVSIQQADGSTRTVAMQELELDDQGKVKIEYGLRTAWRNSRGICLLVAALLYSPIVFLQGLRLQWLLRAQSVSLTFWECTKLSVAGNFLNFATPLGSNAGDVFKAVVVAKHTTHKTEAAATIVLDRVVGLGTLLLCVGAIIAVCPPEGPLGELRPFVFTFVAAGLIGVAFYLSPFLRPAVRAIVPKSWFERTEESALMGHVHRIDQAARELARRKAILFGAIFLTVALQVMAMTAYFSIATALRLDTQLSNMLEYYAYFYTGLVIQALPGPPQGLGTVELAYRYFFAQFGSVSQIVCMAFMIRIMVLACSLPGLLVTMTGSYKPREVKAGAVPSPTPHAH